MAETVPPEAGAAASPDRQQIPQLWEFRLSALLKKKELNSIHTQQTNLTTTRIQDLQTAQQLLEEQLLDLQSEGILQHVWDSQSFHNLQQRLILQVRQSVRECFGSTGKATAMQEHPSSLQLAPLLAYQSRSRELVSTTTPANLKKVPFDLLVAQADQVWLTPFISDKWQDQLVHITLPLFLGDRFKDSLTAVQWAINVSQLLFMDVGMPVKDAIRWVRRCFPEKSRTKIWYARLLQEQPDIDYDHFIRHFVMTFETTADIADTRTQLFNLRQRSMSMAEFANSHAQLWWLAFPNSTERELVMNWEFRLNMQCTAIFQKYLSKLLEQNQSPTFDHALHHMERKLEDKAGSTVALVSSQQNFKSQGRNWSGNRSRSVSNVIPDGWQSCNLGCYLGRHREGSLCAATKLKCFDCDEVGHFRTSILCKKRKQAAITVLAEGPEHKRQKEDHQPASGANAVQVGLGLPPVQALPGVP